MNTYSFIASAQKINEIKEYFQNYDFTQPNQYIDFQVKLQEAVITVYKSGKVVIQGKEASLYNDMFNLPKVLTLPQAGSDEVGTGDFFGPICVCASFIDEDVYSQIQKWTFDDSKKLTDEYIRKTIPKIIDIVPHSLLVLNNAKYNEVILSNNMNRIKARMHNQAYINLQKKGIQLPNLAVVDDFCGETLYYKYLNEDKEVFHGLSFTTKAESKYLSVAISSMICRYRFLEIMDQYSEIYQMTFPKGAGSIVDEFAKEFINKYSFEELHNVAKMNFKNVEKLIKK